MLEYDKRYRAANAGESRTGQPFAPDPPGTLPGCPPSRGQPRCRYWRVGCQAPVTRGGVHCRAHGLEFARAAEAWRRDRLAAKLATAQGWICTWCCQPLPADLDWTNIDHVIPASRGGPHDRWNLDVLHSRCNIAKRDKITPRALELAAEHGITIAAYLDRAGVTESVSADSARLVVTWTPSAVPVPVPPQRARSAAVARAGSGGMNPGGNFTAGGWWLPSSRITARNVTGSAGCGLAYAGPWPPRSIRPSSSPELARISKS
jgi:HNH endonuclease